MTKYRVPIKIEFAGVVWVNAESEEKAEEIAVMQIAGNSPTIYSHGHPDIVEWAVNPFGFTERRDNESIEEL